MSPELDSGAPSSAESFDTTKQGRSSQPQTDPHAFGHRRSIEATSLAVVPFKTRPRIARRLFPRGWVIGGQLGVLLGRRERHGQLALRRVLDPRVDLDRPLTVGPRAVRIPEPGADAGTVQGPLGISRLEFCDFLIVGQGLLVLP